MSQKTYMYDTQWQALINAIDGGDTSAIATALGKIKTSIDTVETALGSLSADVTQDSTQWTNLINAISSGGGGGGGTIDIDATQWSNLISAINAFNSAYQSNVILGTNLDGRPSSTGVSLDLFNSAFNTSPQWTVVTNSYIDIYLYKMGILKLLWLDIAKSQIPSGWIPGGFQQLPSGYEALLSPQMNVNDTMRNGTQVNMTVNSSGMFSINASATITANTAVRLSFMYI